MTATTPNYAIPYPEITDFVKDGATAMEAIAEKVDDILSTGAAARNLLYNGAMQVAQRRTSLTGITTSGYYTADRWNFAVSSAGTWTQSIADGATDYPSGTGLRKSLKMLCTTPDASLAASDLAIILQKLEGQDLQVLAKGTASAKPVTLSFWVKSNVPGTYIADIYDPTNSRGISRSYTISTSDWEYKTLTFPGDTTGALANNNAESLNFRWWLAAGSSYQSGTLQTSWAASSSSVAVGQVNVAATLNNAWQITGVQLTVGSVAVPFEFKPFEQELRECQRYYEKSYLYGTIPGTATFEALITMAYSSAAGTSGELGGHVMMNTYKRIAPNVTWYDQGGNVNKCTRLQAGVANHNNQAVVNGSIGEHYLGIASTSGAAGTCAIQVHFVAECELA